MTTGGVGASKTGAAGLPSTSSPAADGAVNAAELSFSANAPFAANDKGMSQQMRVARVTFDQCRVDESSKAATSDGSLIDSLLRSRVRANEQIHA